ncbi:hypothetical protein RN001_001798 [Aquatica leii]|uniref:Bromo domain-containing protein n=1 Tax=Aquatica leii TaxID=1421715 RepID=A0AAN7SJR7_9COLE|nr:hypothetical protein RN001_001798 [Aquatica leii]
MVHTRRMDSSTTAPDNGLRHRTRSSTQLEESEQSNVSESETEGEHSWSPTNKTKRIHKSQRNKTIPSSVRQLRSKFSSDRLHKRELKSTRISLDERHSLSVYSTRNMHDDSDTCNGNDSDEEVFSLRARKSRHLRHSRSTLTQLEKRTALSLRPLRSKCYADPHSPLTYNTDESTPEKDVRRSTRKRTMRFSEMTWLTDNQMPKVGYPNLATEDYSEEDSRDIQNADCHNSKSHRNTYETRRTTRLAHSLNGIDEGRNMKKNTKYLFDFKNSDTRNTRNRRNIAEHSTEDKVKTRRESNDNKENKENNIVNGRLKDMKENFDNVDESESMDSTDRNDTKDDIKQEEEEHKNEEKKVSNDSSDNENCEEEQGSTETDDIRKVRNRQIINRIDSSKRRKRKCSESSSSSEVNNRVYSLRQRAPKPSGKQKLPSKVLSEREHVLRPRRHFTRRIVSSNSSSNSSSDSEVVRKPSKYRTPNSKGQHGKNDHLIKSGSGSNKPLPIGPETIDNNVRFSSVGGLDGHVQCLKEMILLPMMYPEVFKQFQIQPPRGVLFHGPPGTGKTLIARALANECSFGSRKVSFFMRKGADLLSKWVGESEKQLRLLFEQAQEMHPSIIFFDELDGLAPVRSSRQDQIHASIVSTLLALMDGLDNRGEVVVIGATNRIDAIDPALRRPGRFDRELFFPLPSRKERFEILNIHVSKWSPSPKPELLSFLAERAIGYCGSDLRALCSEAVIQSLRRTYPQVYTADYRLLLDPTCVKVEKIDFLRAKSLLVPASHRVTQTLGRKLMPILKPLLGEPLESTLNVLKESFPHGLDPVLAKVKLAAGFRPAQLLLVGAGPQHGQTLHLAPALLNHMEHIHAYVLDLAMLYRETARSPEETCIQVFQEAKRNVPSVIYIPNVDQLWNLAHETVKAIFLSQLQHMDPNVPILLLATANASFNKLDQEVQNIFSLYRKEVYQLNPPNAEARRAFFRPLLIDACLKSIKPTRKQVTTPPPLPRAPTPPPTPISEETAKKLYEQEERTLRELRIFLRDMCKKLANNKLFFMFTKPVDTEEVPDYTAIIKEPMDLETMMTKVDFHKYGCARDFLTDIELIVRNALEYNPAKTSADKQIRHRACSLRDYAHTLIKNEMDSDFEEKCQRIAKERMDRKVSVAQYLPAYITTAENSMNLLEEKETKESVQEPAPEPRPDTENPVQEQNSNRKSLPLLSTTARKRKYSWQRGCLKRKRKQERHFSNPNSSMEDQPDGKPSSGEDLNIDRERLSQNHLNIKLEWNCSDNLPLNNSKTITTPLSVNCGNATDTLKNHQSSPIQSPNTKPVLTELLSPSELLDDPLDFDDIDRTLNENGEDEETSKIDVIVNKEELETTLEQAVMMTANKSLQSLIDLHNELSRIVRQYSRTSNRKSLPKDLRVELWRYKKDSSSLENTWEDLSQIPSGNVMLKKSRKIYLHLTGTGGGAATEKKLNDIEERLLHLVSKIHLGDNNEIQDMLGVNTSQVTLESVGELITSELKPVIPTTTNRT